MRLDRLPVAFRVLIIFASLYLFLVGIGAMGSSFKILGKGYLDELLGMSTNPVLGLFVGILATTLVQSSSVTTSLVVGAVGGGGLSFDMAVFMIMGANVGTTVTSTIVSMGHLARKNELQRAFAAATVHDFFNLVVLVVLFPLEVATGWLSSAAQGLGDVFTGSGEAEKAFDSPIKALTAPAVGLMKTTVGGSGGWLLAMSVALTFAMLIMMVKGLKSIMMSRVAGLFDRVIFKTPPRALAFGTGLTVLVQSSSITTSVAVPLAGAGLITVEQIFPYVLGANIGTTCTSMIASLGSGAADALKVAFFHVIFNTLGVILIWWIRWLPISMAKRFARLAVWNRAIPFVFIVIVFYLIPLAIVFLWS